jgi:transcriptional regulator with XRE-family HTH domain
MTLREYLDEKKLSQGEAAAALKVSPSEVSLWLSGKRRPSYENGSKIEEWSGGAVTAKDWAPKKSKQGRRPAPRRVSARVTRHRS